MSKQDDSPEKIFGWLDSQLSVARHYGGCTYKGRTYKIDYDGEGQPLVREDILKKLVKIRKHQASIPKFQKELIQ